MDTLAITLAWALAMLVAVAVNALGWRSWFNTFPTKHDPVQRGAVDLQGSPEEVSMRLAKQLAASSGPVLGRILEADHRTVRAELRPNVSSRRGDGYSTTTALLVCHIDERIEGCRVEYSLDPRDLGRGLRTGAAAMLGLGVVAILAAAVIFPVLVIPSESLAVRGQTAQVFQLAHFLWPPFLLTHQARRTRTALMDHIGDLMSNLPYV